MMAAVNPAKWRGIALVTLAFGAAAWITHDSARRLFNEWYGHGNVSVSTQVPTVEQSSPERPGYSVSNIIDAHIFGRADKGVQTEISQVSETKLQINLLGLIASADRQIARAFIDVNGSRIKSYSIGDQIDKTDAAVHTVEPNRVLLKRGDAFESLPLKRQDAFNGLKPLNNEAGANDAAMLPQPSAVEEENQGGINPGTTGNDTDGAIEQSLETNTIQRDDRNIELRKPF